MKIRPLHINLSLLLLFVVNVFFFSGYTPQASDSTQSEYYEDSEHKLADKLISTSLNDHCTQIQYKAIAELAFQCFRQFEIDQIEIQTLLRQNKKTCLAVKQSIIPLLPHSMRACSSETEVLHFQFN